METFLRACFPPFCNNLAWMKETLEQSCPLYCLKFAVVFLSAFPSLPRFIFISRLKTEPGVERLCSLGVDGRYDRTTDVDWMKYKIRCQTALAGYQAAAGLQVWELDGSMCAAGADSSQPEGVVLPGIRVFAGLSILPPPNHQNNSRLKCVRT